ncbi:phytoene/squalene synthase family protein [Gordonia hydrophobica]|uniref:Phytoene/squalene synthase family protein n=1 Tax=Gordonia hydrophobica TaxID=40516 RepID=A0ABZ2TYU5_9ACTN|nr:phytoene/squalene synthase family protein [Gordonia hydrophobica]MBM7367097.1 phytoene synthase [Gordonia hydrophobica]
MADSARGYRLAEAVARRSGRTYHLAARLLPSDRRRAIHALYAYARLADDIVDDPGAPLEQAHALDAMESGLRSAVAGASADGVSRDAADILAALAESVDRFQIPMNTFAAFNRSMRMDLPGDPLFRNRYVDFADLAEYTYGSAAVIGLQLLPVLGADVADPDVAAGAALLGDAFQLTNFLRDVGEDAARDRIYLPLRELAAFGVDEQALFHDAATHHTSEPLRRGVAHLIAVNRDQYRRTRGAIAALPPRTRPAIVAAARSYSAILVQIEAQDHDVLARRAVVPVRRRIGHAVASLSGRP